MVTSAAQNVEQYLAELPDDRRDVMTAMRKLIRRHLPKGYVESMTYGMILYGIPLETYPNTYNNQPLGYVALAAQKNYYALYMFAYADEAAVAEMRAGFQAAGKKLDMGKSCVRFRKLDDLALDAIGTAIASTPPDRFIELYEAVRAETKTAAKKKKSA
ncbi:MAG TPA: DUF1801 domain-containing protein [Thermoanaerobaculia bacterium]|nr:DUF1801 domain-containing protein [Thermoanaerobaculia bacterium]